VHIVTMKRLEQASEKYREATREIGAWNQNRQDCSMAEFLKSCGQTFPMPDDVDGFVVFNIRHNRPQADCRRALRQNHRTAIDGFLIQAPISRVPHDTSQTPVRGASS